MNKLIDSVVKRVRKKLGIEDLEKIVFLQVKTIKNFNETIKNFNKSIELHEKIINEMNETISKLSIINVHILNELSMAASNEAKQKKSKLFFIKKTNKEFIN